LTPSESLDGTKEKIAMNHKELNAVTGAFSYTGKYISSRLLAQGKQVINLTGHPERPTPAGQPIKAVPFHFDQPEALVSSLQGVGTLYNTYWVRFNYGKTTFASAVQNTRILIQAAKSAGVERIVHVSITNPSLDSPLPYFRGKAQLEEAIQQSGLSYAILRPTVVFGEEDILINNIAYLLRRSPLFAIPGSGDYRLQPIFVDDLAEIAVQAGQESQNFIRDTAGPETFSFNELVELLAARVHSQARILHLSPDLALFLSRLVGIALRDVVLTPNEMRGLMANLLVSEDPPMGHTSLSSWLEENGEKLGQRYASELQRHYRPPAQPHFT
jgi:uncharacterized protein YbjT (DUF2867 family)